LSSKAKTLFRSAPDSTTVESVGLARFSKGPVRLLIATALATAALLVLAAAPALAVPHVFSTTIGSTGSGAGQLSNPQDVAVDQSTGDIYVADAGNLRVDKFDSAGNFILAFGRAVDQTSGADLCTAASGDTCQAGTPGTGNGAFIFAAYVEVDNSTGPSAGDVYVGDTNTPSVITADDTDVVSKFTPDGVHIPNSDNDGSAANTGESFGSNSVGIQGMTVDPGGNLWVFHVFQIDEYAPNGQFLQTWTPNFTASSENFGIAADASHVYQVNSGRRVGRYSITGRYQGIITRGGADIRRVAVDPDTGEVYANRGGTQIERYNASCAPTLVSDPFPANAGCPPSDVFGSGDLTSALGLALNQSTSALYVADAGTDQVKVFVPPPPGPPVIANQWASSVGSAGATVNAAVNPMRNDTSCQLQYVDDPSFQANGYTAATTLPCGPADLGSRFADQPAKADLSALAPGTLYHFRFLAHSSAGDDTGADRTFSTEIPEVGLPDNRAYEQVTPANKDQGGIRDDASYQGASNGNRVGFVTQNALPGSASDGRFYNSTRGTTGWSTVNQIPPQSQGTDGQLCINFEGITANAADLSRSALADGFGQSFFGCGKDDPELVPGEPAGVQNLFIRDNAAGTYQLLSLNPVTGPPADADFAGADPGFTRVLFTEAAQLTPDAPPGATNLYQWSGGALTLVSIDPAGTPLASGGGPASGGNGYAHHAVSDDGSKVFFQGGDGNLYARVGGTSTVQLDASQGPGPGGGGQFQSATSDGSKVFFTDDAAAGLTSDTQSGSGTNLYRYDFSTGDLTDLTPTADAEVLGLSGAGNSGADVYFVADGDLGGGATAGQANLYSWHTGVLTFIATLSSDFPNNCAWDLSGCARVSADGSHLAFNSDQSLTSVDTGGRTEVYLYDQGSDQLACASCPPTGAQPASGAAIQNAPAQGFLTATTVLTRNLNSDGSRLFFTSDGPLVARDTNGRQDVYEYSAGKPHLISTGTAATGASFLDASATGDDVFFSTEQQLLSSDIDGARDIYDARVGGGFPEPPNTPPCSGEACKPPASTPPPDQNPGSSSFSGPGNQGKNLGGSATSPKKKKCKKGKKGKKCRKKARRANATGRAGR
jgi:hypothetical protein